MSISSEDRRWYRIRYDLVKIEYERRGCICSLVSCHLPDSVTPDEDWDNKHALSAGIQQAIDYAQILDIPFAYEEAAEMRILLAGMNADLMKKSPYYVTRIVGEDKEGKKQLDNFILVDEPYPVIVTTSELLSTGVDCKTCGLIVPLQAIERV